VAARWTRTRVIGGYDSQERELEGLSVYFLFLLITLLSKGGDQLREILGEDQEVLGSP
jgi:hypothetical protein